MNTLNAHKQQGAVLFVALVMLLVLTALAVTSMGTVSLESRITANRVETNRLQNLADGALREGEMRFYGPAYRREKLEPNISENCKLSNKLNRFGNNKPCLLEEMSPAELTDFFASPIDFFKTNNYRNKFEVRTAAEYGNGDVGNKVLAWMPYRGLDWQESNYFKAEENRIPLWNAYRVQSGSDENESVNPEYGMALSGEGTYFFLITSQVNDQIAAQSTIAVIYTGDLD